MSTLMSPDEVIYRLKIAADAEKRARESELMELPEYAALYDAKRKYAALYMTSRGSEAEAACAQMKNTEERMRAIEMSVPEFPQCPVCGGAGTVAGRVCDCALPVIYEKSFGAENPGCFWESFEVSNPQIFDDEKNVGYDRTQRQAFEVVLRAVRGYAEKYTGKADRNMLLTGNPGLGKTFLCRCIARDVSSRMPVLYLAASQLERLFHEHRLGGDIRLEFIWDAPLLIIDDLGTEPFTQNVTAEYLSELTERRLGALKGTVISTNLNRKDLTARYGERITSRLFFSDLCLRINLYGQDVRDRSSLQK